MVTVGPRNDEALNQKIVHIEDWHWIGKEYETPLEITAKIRYRQSPQKAKLLCTLNSALITFNETQRSIPPGQVAVAYIDDECIGS